MPAGESSARGHAGRGFKEATDYDPADYATSDELIYALWVKPVVDLDCGHNAGDAEGVPVERSGSWLVCF